jgi:uncharacterized membrane protein YfcA
MLTPLLTIPVGLILGFLAGLGVGGGSLLILWLTIIAELPHTEARAINLMFFLAAAGSVSVFRWKKGTLDFKSILPAIVAGCVAAGLCSWLGAKIDQQILKKVFGGLLLFTGIRELFYRPRNAR